MTLDAFGRLRLGDLETLARAIAKHRLMFPVTAATLRAANLEAFVPLASILAPFDAAALETFVQVLIAERMRHADEHRTAEVVWTGPQTQHGQARSTAVVVRDLFRSAEREVFVAGYSFEGGKTVLEPLVIAMRERGVAVRMVIDASQTPVYGQPPQDKVLRKTLEAFLGEVWTFGRPLPEVVYDPRTLLREPTAEARPSFAPVSMHAKCIVIDRKRVLVGSANFTARGHRRNIEVGLCLDDPIVAEDVLAPFHAAIGHGLLRRADLEPLALELGIVQSDVLALDDDLFDDAWIELARALVAKGVAVEPGGDIVLEGRVVGASELVATKGEHSVQVVGLASPAALAAFAAMEESGAPALALVPGDAQNLSRILEKLGAP
jgi:phosphatidylserine/phosphatidylglycerophosphate/cardiolipin synthase-like enzyme